MSDNIKYDFIKKLKTKYKIVVFNENTIEKMFSVKINLLLIWSIFIVFTFILIVVTFILFSFTPLKEYVPGKTSSETHRDLIVMSTKIDSLTMVINQQGLYYDNFKNILNGSPIKKYKNPDSNFSISSNVNLNTSKKDSLFRLKVELETSGDILNKNNNDIVFFYKPIDGVFTEYFDKKKKHFGVDIVAGENEFVFSVADGVVFINNWTTETGYVVGVQHLNGFISLYKHNSKVLKSIGEFVRGGEAIAVIGNSGELTTGPHLHFELWKNGEGINPLNYIKF
tara:strand:- start:34606 stop:35451 length:846 start_codon:yes stop_codon:yes gene_type:complete